MSNVSANTLASELPKIPVDADGPVFAQPWQAQAFAMTVKLHEKNAFTWQEWADSLSAELKAAGPQDPPENYYLHWLSALEKLLDEKNITNTTERQATKSQWTQAAKTTPHGRPIVLVDLQT